MNILGKKAIAPISNVYGKKMKSGLNSFGNKLMKTVAHSVINHAVDQTVKHYSPLEKR